MGRNQDPERANKAIGLLRLETRGVHDADGRPLSVCGSASDSSEVALEEALNSHAKVVSSHAQEFRSSKSLSDLEKGDGLFPGTRSSAAVDFEEAHFAFHPHLVVRALHKWMAYQPLTLWSRPSPPPSPTTTKQRDLNCSPISKGSPPLDNKLQEGSSLNKLQALHRGVSARRSTRIVRVPSSYSSASPTWRPPCVWLSNPGMGTL